METDGLKTGKAVTIETDRKDRQTVAKNIEGKTGGYHRNKPNRQTNEPLQ